MNTMTAQEKLDAAQHYITRILRQAEVRINEYSEQMQNDYREFFRWHAADMYEAQEIREYFSKMPKVEEFEGISAFANAIESSIKNIEYELIGSPVFGTYTNEMMNVEYRIILNSKRQIRVILLELQAIIEC